MANEQDQDGVTDPKVEAQAKEMGWTPQDKFKGDPEKWVTAEEYVRRGEHVLPILRQTNARLKNDLLQRDQEIDKLNTKLGTVQQTLDRLDDHYSAANQQAAKNAINNLKDQLKQAREDNDVDAEVELLSQIGLAQDEVKRIDKEVADRKSEKEKEEANSKGKKTPDDPDPELSQEIKDWQKENKDWFGIDGKKTKQFNRIAEDLHEEEPELRGKEFLERCGELWEEQHGEKGLPDKTGSNSNKGSSGNTGVIKGWNQLPKEAKDACMADADILVGEGKQFKTVDEWQKEYVRIYSAL